ncbi:MAG: 50S ribosomal protein L24 [Patescibacteria group bacterium]
MQIKSGDNVIVLTGKDKGKSGKVVKAFPKEDKVLIEGVNIKKRHKRATRQGQKGQIVEMPHPIHVSNVKKADDAKPKKTTKKAKAETK